VEIGGVVYDVIEVSFRAYKDMSPDCVANAAPKVKQEMIAGEVVGATCGESAISVLVIEEHGFSAHPSHKVGSGSFGEARGKHSISVVKNRTKFLISVIGNGSEKSG
jgi:hypothetical protein